MDDSELTSKMYEKLAAAVQRQLDEAADIQHDVKVVGVRSGKKRQIDVAMRGRIGSKAVLIVAECRNYKRAIDVPKIDAFVGFLDDVQADAGIMVTTVGYSDAALQRAFSEGIETWVLRPASDEDWEGYLRSIALTVNVRGLVHRNQEIHLESGEVLPVRGFKILYRADLDEAAFLDHILNYIVHSHAVAEGKRYVADILDPLYLDETKRDRVVKVAAESSTEVLMTTKSLVSSPKDWVFRRYLPNENGERTFLEVAKLREIADTEFSP
ncbi:MAG: restriction endonuclease [Myxococcales bacterium]|nr:restriction endonuclease [Myxococcales bacterium]